LPYTYINHVSDTVGLVHALGYSSVAAVVGHDYGSPVAAWTPSLTPQYGERARTEAGGRPQCQRTAGCPAESPQALPVVLLQSWSEQRHAALPARRT
jgi:hypothetical protein